jgi:hypothetical protein
VAGFPEAIGWEHRRLAGEYLRRQQQSQQIIELRRFHFGCAFMVARSNHLPRRCHAVSRPPCIELKLPGRRGEIRAALYGNDSTFSGAAAATAFGVTDL